MGSSLHSQKNACVRVTLPGRQNKDREPYSNNGEEGEAGRDGRSTALQQGSARLQSVLAGQIELISATGIFRCPPPPLSTSFVMKCMNALTRMCKTENTHRIPNVSVSYWYILFNFDCEMSQVKLCMIGFTQTQSYFWEQNKKINTLNKQLAVCSLWVAFTRDIYIKVKSAR